MKEVSAMEMFIAFRKAIQDLIKEKPDATAKDVLQGLELTLDMVKLINKHLITDIK